MADLIIPYLPSLTDDRRIPELESPGRWEANEVGVYLQRLAMSLEDESGAETRFSNVVSVPDVWAHPLVFTAAWLDGDHVAHRQAVSEWRGLLALLGLCRHNLIEVDFSVVDLSDLSRDPWKSASSVSRDGKQDGVAGTPNLMAILHQNMPRLVLTPNQSWNNLAIIHIGLRPVGLVIPPALVCPARAYGDVLPHWVDWRDPETGHLSDPVEGQHISLGECNALAYYLDNVIAKVQDDCSKLGDRSEVGLRIRGNLEHELKRYRHDVGELAARLGRRSGEDACFTLARDDKERQPPVLYPFLFQYPTTESDQGRSSIASDALLKVRADIASPLKGAVIVDAGIAEQNGLDPRSVRIWGQYFLADIEKVPGVFDVVADFAAREGYAMLRTEDLFAETLFRISNGQVKAHAGEACRYLLPLKLVTLLFATGDQLRDTLHMTTNSESVVVTLELLVTSEAGVQRRYRAVKRYSISQQVQEIARPDVLALWPDFKSPSWTNHFVFHSAGPKDFIPLKPFFAGAAQQALNGRDDPVAHLPRVFEERFFAADADTDSIKRFEAPGEEVGLRWLSDAPEALICGLTGPGPQELRSIGMLLLGSLPAVEPDGTRWKVGIDFGTTNTNVYYAKDEGVHTQPKVMRFRGRFRTPFENHAGLAPSILQDEFLPNYDIDPPFLSMLQEHGRRPSHVKKPLFSRCIYYADEAVGSMLSRLIDNGAHRRWHFDLKWSRESDNLELIEDYIAQVALQAYAELVNNGAQFKHIDWCFSYPGSFTKIQRDDFKTIYANAVKRIVGPEPSPSVDDKSPQIRQESEAAALYFIKQQEVGFSSSVVTIDVGGRTSDICIWNARQLRWRASLHLGGKHTLIRYLANHVGLLDLFPFAKHELEKIKVVFKRATADPQKFEQALEILVNSGMFRKVFDENLPYLRDEPEVRGLLLLAEFSFAGLLYYVAKVCAYLNQAERLCETNDTLTVCLGGRGSLMLRKIIEANKLASATKLFQQASGLNWRIDAFNVSNEPKHEVAFGLLIDPAGAGELNWSEPLTEVLFGEKLIVGGKEATPEDAFRLEHLDHAWALDDIPEFERFVKVYEKAFGRAAPLKRYKKQLVSRSYNELQDLRHWLTLEDPRSAEAAEPVFIVVLREFIKLLNEKVDVIEPRRLKFPGGLFRPSFNRPY